MICPYCGSRNLENLGPMPMSTMTKYRCKSCNNEILSPLYAVKTSSSTGTLGSVMSQAKKLKSLNKGEFVYGINEDKCIMCPGCGKRLCYYMGVTPSSVKCANPQCRWFEKPKKEDN